MTNSWMERKRKENTMEMRKIIEVGKIIEVYRPFPYQSLSTVLPLLVIFCVPAVLLKVICDSEFYFSV